MYLLKWFSLEGKHRPDYGDLVHDKVGATEPSHKLARSHKKPFQSL